MPARFDSSDAAFWRFRFDRRCAGLKAAATTARGDWSGWSVVDWGCWGLCRRKMPAGTPALLSRRLLVGLFRSCRLRLPLWLPIAGAVRLPSFALLLPGLCSFSGALVGLLLKGRREFRWARH
jgi:hypothetical protein